ncbi:hypothetical protein MNBD_GAMMA08-199 [hydrothermal vent metagenome]|uniref:Uncharacterized protein n=1 Tax=hydrothermal vent metagenome TaxID=652676 RepID=A0A3B0XQG9_9ZZZZ
MLGINVTLTLTLSQRERGSRRFSPPLPLREGWGGVTTVYRFNRLIQISIRRTLYKPLPDKSVRCDDLKSITNVFNNYFHAVNN